MTARTDKTAAPDVADIEAQLKALRADMATLADLLAAFGPGKAADWRAKAQALADQADAGALQTAADLAQQAQALEQGLKDQVRTQPVQSLLLAFGLGAGIALLLRR